MLVLLDAVASSLKERVDDNAPTSILRDKNFGPELADAAFDDVRTQWPRISWEE